jgi:hypothetical protein
MLTSVDRESGEKLDDINILAQCVTFLVAGHETTSGLLSFVRVPTQSGRAFRLNPAGDSDAKQPPIPRQASRS